VTHVSPSTNHKLRCHATAFFCTCICICILFIRLRSLFIGCGFLACRATRCAVRSAYLLDHSRQQCAHEKSTCYCTNNSVRRHPKLPELGRLVTYRTPYLPPPPNTKFLAMPRHFLCTCICICIPLKNHLLVCLLTSSGRVLTSKLSATFNLSKSG
jgi:hypothetical protein